MSDEDEPAPSPSATVVARRASREAKSMRERSPAAIGYVSSDDEWDPVQEQDEKDEQDEQDEGNQGFADASTYFTRPVAAAPDAASA